MDNMTPPRGQAEFLEFRVLAGLQAGAHLRLLSGQYLLGASPRCDIVLEGHGIQPEHALLTVGDSGGGILQAVAGTIYLQDGQDAGASLELHPNMAVRLGDAWIGVALEESPWEDSPPLPMKNPQTTPSPPNPPADGQTPAALPEPAVPANPESMRWHYAFAILLAIALCLGGLVLFGDFSPPNKPPPTTAIVDIKEAIQRAIVAQGLQGRVTAKSGTDGKVIVTGFVTGKDEKLLLDNSLRPFSAHTRLELFDESELLEQANGFLASLSLPLHVESMGNGRLRLIGAAHTFAEAERASQQLTDKLPIIQDIDIQVLYPDQLADKFRQMIESSAIAKKLKRVRKGDVIFVRGQLNSQEMMDWENLFHEYNRQYGAILSIEASFTVPADLLPFRVSQIIGGPMPVVITAEGAHILQGGIYRGYKLVNIDDHRIVFDGPNLIEIER